MADAEEAAAAPPRAPAMRWWMALLVVSLALNLVVAGALAVRFFAPQHFEHFTGSGFSPLIPRKFLTDLPADRRKQLGDLLRQNRGEFHNDFADIRKFAGQLADALQHDPYDEKPVMDAIDGYEKVANGMVGRGSQVTMDVIRKLTPDERAVLAGRIRERVGRRK